MGGDAARGMGAALHTLPSMVMREAQTLSFADAFLTSCACFVVATLMVPLMKKAGRPAAPSADAH